MRPTDVCHPIELRAPAPRAFPARSRHFRSGDTPRRLRLRAALPGDRTFHDARKTASADRRCNTLRLVLLVSRPCFGESRARAFSSRGADAIEPLTPLSRAPMVHPHASLGFPRAATWPYLSFWEVGTGRRMRRPPRPPVSIPRERERLVMIRDAFYR